MKQREIEFPDIPKAVICEVNENFFTPIESFIKKNGFITTAQARKIWSMSSRQGTADRLSRMVSKRVLNVTQSYVTCGNKNLISNVYRLNDKK